MSKSTSNGIEVRVENQGQCIPNTPLLDISTPTPSNNKDNGGSVFTQGDDMPERTKVTNERKRQRMNTSESSIDGQNIQINIEEFQSLSVDDKMTVMFTELSLKMDKCMSVHSKVELLERKIDNQESRIAYLEYRALILEARSRRNNLIFSGIAESRDENCVQVITEFITSRLNMVPCPNMPRVHRLGRFSRDKTRPIIVNFLDFHDTECILKRANLLKGTNFSINRDFPHEITEARKSLWPELKRLRSDFPRSKISLVYPAKIVQDGRVVADRFPDWNRVLFESRVSTDIPLSRDTADQDRQSYTAPTPSLFSHVVRADNQINATGTGRPRSGSQSPPPKSRGRAPSRRSNWTQHGSREGASQFSRPWDEPPADSSRSPTPRTQGDFDSRGTHL